VPRIFPKFHSGGEPIAYLVIVGLAQLIAERVAFNRIRLPLQRHAEFGSFCSV
jgi:hypothetical protein